MSDQTPDPVDVIAGELRIQSGVHGGDNRPFLDRAEQIAQALADAGFRVRHFPAPKHVAGVSAYQWTDEYKPTAPASMSPRQAALEILAELDWSVVIESLSMFEDMDPLAYYGLHSELFETKWLDGRWFMGSTLRSHLSAWATSRMALKSWCINEDHHDGDMIWFNDCWHGDEEHSPCEWGYCWALDGDPEEFLVLAMDLLREGWEPEEAVPVVDDATRREVEALVEAIKAMRPDPSEPAPPGWDADDREGDRNVYRAADLLAAAYLPPPRLTDASYSGRTYK